MSESRLYRFIKANLQSLNTTNNQHDGFSHKQNKKRHNYFLLQLKTSGEEQVYSDQDQSYKLTAHHLSFYEIEDDQQPFLSQYHYTAYFINEKNEEYPLHIFFDENDQLTIQPIFTMQSKPGKVELSPEFSANLKEFAIKHSAPIIMQLRAKVMHSDRKLFKYIQQNDEERALSVLQPEHIHLCLAKSEDYAIHQASKKGFTRLVAQLLLYGANPYALNKDNENAVSIANRGGFNGIMLAIYKCDFKVTIDIGTYLLDAVANNDVKEVRLFCKKAGKEVISHTMRVWTKGTIKNSLLHVAYIIGSREMVELLINYDADTEYKNKLGQKPSDLSTIEELRGCAGKSYMTLSSLRNNIRSNSSLLQTFSAFQTVQRTDEHSKKIEKTALRIT